MSLLVLVVVGYLIAVIVIANIVDRDTLQPKKQSAALGYPYVTQPATPVIASSRGDSAVADKSGLRTLHTVMLSLIVGVVLLNGLGVLLAGFAPGLLEEDGLAITVGTAIQVSIVGTIAAALAGSILYLAPVRERLAKLLGPNAAYNPRAAVHQTALILAILLLADTLMNVLQLGGVEGLAEQFEEQPIRRWDAVLNLLLFILVTLLGVGLLVRRRWSQVLSRLDVRRPTLEDFIWGMATAFGCVIAVFVFVGLLSLVISPETLEAQGAASSQIAEALSQSLLIAFLAAASAAVGEELLFRGALQPIFGIIPTTLLFALLHSQYSFTTSSLAIIFVGGAFAYLKEKQSTTAAIIAHFAYNFFLLGLAYFAFQLEEMGITPESFESVIYMIRIATLP